MRLCPRPPRTLCAAPRCAAPHAASVLAMSDAEHWRLGGRWRCRASPGARGARWVERDGSSGRERKLSAGLTDTKGRMEGLPRRDSPAWVRRARQRPCPLKTPELVAPRPRSRQSLQHARSRSGRGGGREARGCGVAVALDVCVGADAVRPPAGGPPLGTSCGAKKGRKAGSHGGRRALVLRRVALRDAMLLRAQPMAGIQSAHDTADGPRCHGYWLRSVIACTALWAV
eukprot:364505-Chlamydomonas_euryale.AAC.6